MIYNDYELILFLNTVLAASCSLCIFIGTWPFQGLMHAWFFKNWQEYSWTTHVMMTWFDVGCIGLFFLNLQAFLTFDQATTSQEAYAVVFNTNTIMHFLWGIHNLQQVFPFRRNYDETKDEMLRRPWPLLFYSVLGACGSAVARNSYIVLFGYNQSFVYFTWVWEWISLLLIIADFIYFLLFEHTWGMAMKDKKMKGELNDSLLKK